MSVGSGLESSSGKVGIWPVMKHQPSTSTAWLNGATGVGAPGAMKNSGGLIVSWYLPDVIVVQDCRARRMPREIVSRAGTCVAATPDRSWRRNRTPRRQQE